MPKIRGFLQPLRTRLRLPLSGLFWTALVFTLAGSVDTFRNTKRSTFLLPMKEIIRFFGWNLRKTLRHGCYWAAALPKLFATPK
jgi:hypothetical protein